jgi:hypothetical protein
MMWTNLLPTSKKTSTSLTKKPETRQTRRWLRHLKVSGSALLKGLRSRRVGDDMGERHHEALIEIYKSLFNIDNKITPEK